MSEKNKVYGLILPKKQGQVKGKSPAVSSVFQNDSDEDGDAASGPVAPYKVATSSSKLKRQTQMDIDKALQEDPSIYEYDEVYDQLQANKPQVGYQEKNKSAVDRKPKYITGLLKAAEVKKKEEERRLERKVQKEREAEGEMYADKEKFVTSAYKQKMVEMQEAEEKEKREAAFEAMTDVTKQKDMSGFYRYLYRQTGRSGDSEETQQIKEEPIDSANVKQEPPGSPPSQGLQNEQAAREQKRGKRSPSSSSSSPSSDSEAQKQPEKETFSKSRQIKTASSHLRRRRQDSSSSASEPDTAQSKPKSSKTAKARRSRSNSSQSDENLPHHNRVNSRNDRRQHQSPEDSRRNGPPGASMNSRGEKRQVSRSPQRVQDKGRRSRSPHIKRDRQRESLHGREEERKRKRHDSRSPSEDRRGRRNVSRSPERERTSPSPPRRKEKRGEHRLSPSKRARKDVDDEGDSGRVQEKKLSKSDCVNGKDDPVSENLKTLRGTSATGTSKPVDPAKKVYPHHNSAKDIEEARKRFLQRKLAREKERLG